MNDVSIIGVALAKNVFQPYRAAADGTVHFRKKRSRLQFQRFMADHPRCVVAMEAYGGAPTGHAEIQRLGHKVRSKHPPNPACAPFSAATLPPP